MTSDNPFGRPPGFPDVPGWNDVFDLATLTPPALRADMAARQERATRRVHRAFPYMIPERKAPSRTVTQAPGTDRRILTRHKANYAAHGVTLELVCRDGVFTTAALDPEKAAQRQGGPVRDAAADEKFLDLVPKAEQAIVYVHSSTSARDHYAPAVFAARKAGKIHLVGPIVYAIEIIHFQGGVHTPYSP